MILTFFRVVANGDALIFIYLEESWRTSIVRSIRVAAPPALVSYPEDWVKLYTRKQFAALLRYIVSEWDAGVLYFSEDEVYSIPIDEDRAVFWESYRLDLNNPDESLRSVQLADFF